MVHPRASLWLSLSLSFVACGDDVASTAATEGATTTTTASSSGTTGDGTTTGTPTTGVDPTSGATTEAVTGSTSGGTTLEPTTAATTSTSSSTDATSSGSTSSGSSTTGGACGPGEPGPDTDGDTVPDACDACDGGDDLVDGDGDGVADGCDQCKDGDDSVDVDADGIADACDVCPDDPVNDGDGDGICDADDICPNGPNDIDVDNDGKPDACDDQVLLPLVKPADDYDVAGDGALVVVRYEAGSIFATCWNGDRSVRRPEFVAGTYDVMQQLLPYPEIHIARDVQKVLVTWFDQAGGLPINNRVAYSLLDDACQPLVTNATAIAVPDAYFEFHNSAIDAAGNSVVSVSPQATFVNFIDAAGVPAVQQQAFNINAAYGNHIAVNQASGAGILAAQVHSGNGIHYRRFNADGSWVEPGPVQVPVNYHYWYDGFTVGMNDKDEFVFLWRSDGTALDMRFFAADAGVVADVQRPTIDFEGFDGGHCYDSFRRRHQEIPLRGDDFVLGEVYNWITPQQNRVVQHFQYTPAGQLVVEDMTSTNLDEGLTIRIDQVGGTYLRGPVGIEIVTDYP